MIYRFGRFQLDEADFRLSANGTPLALEPKALRVLLCLIRNRGHLVRKQDLLDDVWQEASVTEGTLTRSVGLLRKALGDDSREPLFIETVPTVGYRFVAPVAILDGSPGSVESPAPLGAERPMSPSSARSRSSTRVTSLALAACVILLVVAISRSFGHGASSSRITSLAVLPLDNLTGDPAQNYLADGMTDELTTQLAKDSTLRVISRTSVMQYRGAHRPLPEIARQLNVDGILEGSLSRSGNLVHMTVQLIQAPTDTHLWAESYDRDADDLVTLPQDVSLTIARKTHSSVASSAPQKYINPAAHDAYLRGHYLWFAGNDQASGQYFLKAVQLQPDYALAWAGLSSYYGAGAVDYFLDPRTALPLAVAAARKSLQLDPSLPEAHLDIGALYWVNDWNLNAALNEIDHAIELDPKRSDGWHLRAKILIQLNRSQEAIEVERKAMELDPFVRPWGMCYVLLMSRQFDAAIMDAKQRLEGNPDPALWWDLSEAYQGKGMNKESEQALEKALTLWNDPSVKSVRRAFARGGRKAVLRWYVDYNKAQARKTYVSPYLFASFYAQLGDRQQALAYLDECLRQHAPPILDIQQDTSFDSLHSDPHYRAIVQRIGLPPAY